MRLLCVQLLRMGDVLMLEPTITGLRERFPDAEIHLLTNRSNAIVEFILPEVNHFHYFDRELIQRGLGEKDKPLWYSYDLLAELIQSLNELKFDRVINFTQNTLSAHICSVIDAKDKIGIHFSSDGLLEFNCFWAKSLNSVEDDSRNGAIHFVDHFQLMSGATELKGFTSLYSGKRNPKKVVIQALSSDSKKDMSVLFLRQTLEEWNRIQAFDEVTLICSPAEERRVQGMINEMELSQQSLVRCFPCDLNDALREIDSAGLFLSVDTGIKHLACFSKTPIVEVALGSSHIPRTGVYQEGALIVSPLVDCFPCPHGENCSRSQRDCQNQLSGTKVAKLGYQWKQQGSLEGVCERDLGGIKVEQVQIDGLGLWTTVPLTANGKREFYQGLIHRSHIQLKKILDGEDPNMGLGSLAYQVFQSLDSLGLEMRREFTEFLLVHIESLKLRAKESEEKQKKLRWLESGESRNSPSNLLKITEGRRSHFALTVESRWLEKDLKFTQNLHRMLMEKR